MKKFLSVLIASTLLIGTACEAPKQDTQVVVHISSEPSNLHPLNARSSSFYWISHYLYQSLMYIDLETGALRPQLASAAPTVSEDGLSYTYTLDPSARWNDGSPITAKDVIFSLKIALNPFTQGIALLSYLEYVQDIRIDPENERKFSLEMREYYMLNPYLGNSFTILDQRVLDPDGIWDAYTLPSLLKDADSLKADPTLKQWSEAFNEPINSSNLARIQNSGSGPYQLSAWIPGQQIELARNPNYWGAGKQEVVHQQKPETLIFSLIKDQTSLELAIKQGQVDLSTQLSSPSYLNLSESASNGDVYQLQTVARASQSMLMVNTRPDGYNHPLLLGEPKVRQAIARCLPIDAIIEERFPGLAFRSASPLPISCIDYNDQLSPIPFDLDAARSLLAEAGWSDSDGDNILDKQIAGKLNPLSFKISFLSNPVNKDLVERFALEMKKVGIDCIPDPITAADRQSMLGKKEYDMLMLALSSPPTPYDFKQIWHSENWLQGQNFSGFAHPEADSLIELSRVEPNAERRKQMVYRIQEIMQEELPAIPLLNPSYKTAISTRFVDPKIYPTRYNIYLNLLEEK